MSYCYNELLCRKHEYTSHHVYMGNRWVDISVVAGVWSAQYIFISNVCVRYYCMMINV